MKWLDGITHGHSAEVIIAAALVLIIHVLIALYMASVAKKKGYSDVLHFFICLIFGTIGCILCAAAPDKRLRAEIDELYELYNTLTKEMPKGDVGVIPIPETVEKPSGTTAYQPDAVRKSGEADSSAVDRIKGFWEKKDDQD